MSNSTTQLLTLEEFLKLPETKPASEYINGEIIPKPMPKGRHSRLQGKLGAVVNEVTENQKIAYAFPELRCSFGERSIVSNYAKLITVIASVAFAERLLELQSQLLRLLHFASLHSQ